MDVFINKWLHLLSVIGTLGGLAFAWYVLRPEEQDAQEGQAAEGVIPDAANRAIWKRFGMAIGVTWLVALATGFYNYYKVSPTVVGRYHMFAGMKMGLALLMFVLTLVVAHPPPGMAVLRRNRGPLLIGILVLGVIVVGLSAHLNLGRISGDYIKPPTTQQVEATNPLTYTQFIEEIGNSNVASGDFLKNDGNRVFVGKYVKKPANVSRDRFSVTLPPSADAMKDLLDLLVQHRVPFEFKYLL